MLFIGALLGGMFSGMGAAAQSAMQLKVAREQMDFQERMANTAHQRQVSDLRKAGLNPILSQRLGGAATPPGALAQTTNVGAAMAEGALKGSTTAIAQKRAKQERENLRLQGVNLDKTGQYIDQQKATAKEAENQHRNAVHKLQAEILQLRQAWDFREMERPGAEIERDIDRTEYGQGMRYWNRGGSSVMGTAAAGLIGAGAATAKGMKAMKAAKAAARVNKRIANKRKRNLYKQYLNKLEEMKRKGIR